MTFEQRREKRIFGLVRGIVEMKEKERKIETGRRFRVKGSKLENSKEVNIKTPTSSKEETLMTISKS